MVKLVALLREPKRSVRIVAGVLASLAFLVTGFSWALASPPGAFPDDGFHLLNTWCPPPLNTSGCETRNVKGTTYAKVPRVIGVSGCGGTTTQEKNCLSERYDLQKTWTNGTSTNKLNTDRYPWGYYQFHNHLISNSFNTSVVTMRFANVGIAVGCLAILFILAPTRLRPTLTLVFLVSWVPMGIYFISSNNPSSWSILGVALYSTALYAATQSAGKRRYALIVLAGLGAILCYTSRADAAFYVFVASLVIWILELPSKKQLDLLIFSGVASVVGVLLALDSKHASDALEYTAATPNRFEQLIGLVQSSPNFFFGFWGVSPWSPGWFNANLRPDGPAFVLVSLGILLSLGLKSSSKRKLVAVVISLGAILGIPIVIMMSQGYMSLSLGYQPRYLLPLLVVLLFSILVPVRRGADYVMSLRIKVAAIVFLALSNGISLMSVLRKYTYTKEEFSPLWSGEDLKGGVLFIRGNEIDWWWNIPLGLKKVLILGFLAFLIGALLLTWLSHVSARHSEISPNETAEIQGVEEENSDRI